MKDNEIVFLRSETKIEPLVGRWYAWPHLVSPVQHALNLAYRQHGILKSYVANPSVHDAASKDPELLCAPYVQLTSEHAPRIRALLKATEEQSSDLLGFAKDLYRFDREVQEGANGFSVESFYQRIPERLAGFVEITYDVNNRPSLKLNEELIYGGLDNRDHHEIVFFDGPDHTREFFLNTPRLERDDRFFVKAAFDSPAFNLIARARTQGVPFDELVSSLGLDDVEAVSLSRYLTKNAPTRDSRRETDSDLRIRYFGHACILIQTSEVSILIDPVLAWDRDEKEATFTFDDLPDHIDYVFLTHNHQDHFCPEVFLQLRNRIGEILVSRNNPSNYADPSVKLTLHRLGFRNIRVMDALDEVSLPNGRLVAIPSYGEHADLGILSKHGTFVELAGRKLLLLADADCVDRMLYRRLHAILGDVDYLFIGMECDGAPLSWIYGPYLPNPLKRKDDQSRRLSGSNCEKAWAIVEEFGCKSGVFVYAMGQEPWLKHILGLQYEPGSVQLVESDLLVDRCSENNIPAVRLRGCQDIEL